MPRDLGAFPVQTRAPRDLGAMPSTTSTPQRASTIQVGGVPLSLGQKLEQFRSEAVAPYVARQKETAEASRLGEQTVVQTAFQTGANVIGAGLAPVVAGAGEALKATAPVLSKVPGAGIVGGIATGLGKAYDWTVDKASDVLSTPLGIKVIGEKKQPWERDLEALNEYLQVIPVGKGTKVASVALEKAGAMKKVADIAKAKTEIETIANRIAMGETKDAKIALEGLSNIDVNTKTYAELGNKLNEKVGALASALDEKLASDTRVIPLKDAILTEKVVSRAGDVEVKHNFVQDALKQLDELYKKSNDPVSKKKIELLTEKANIEGLTVKEMNQLARKYGQEFGSKAFGKVNGEPLTSVSAQSFENTRSGIKDTARQFFGDEAYKEIDEKIWQTMATKKLVDRVDEKVLDINQKIKERGLGETVGRAVFNTLDALSMKSLGGFVKAGFPRGQGEKIMNYREIEEALSGNLKRMQELQKIIDGTPDENMLIKKLKEFGAKIQATPNKEGGFVSIGKTAQKDISDNGNKTLVAVHNTTADKLKLTDEIGGMPNPSIAIAKPDTNLYENFGDITLLANSDFVFSPKAKTFAADVYSPRFPQVNTTVKDWKKWDKALNDFGIPHNVLDTDDVYRNIKHSDAVRNAFENQTKYKDFDEFVDAFTQEAGVQKRIFLGYTDSGKRRYLTPITAEKVSKLMNKEATRGGEASFYGLPNVRAKITPQFKSIPAIKKAESRIVSKQDFETVKDEYTTEFNALLEEMSKYYKYDQNSFGAYNEVGQAMGHYVSGSKSALDEVLENYPPELKTKLDSFTVKLAQMPTEYFETKFNRPVSLSEFSYAVIPENTPKATKELLKKNGIAFETYTKGEGKQTEAIKRVAAEKGLLFGLGALGYYQVEE